MNDVVVKTIYLKYKATRKLNMTLQQSINYYLLTIDIIYNNVLHKIYLLFRKKIFLLV